ncbi:DUF5103 domain-containing protein [Pontibacter sp. SGAir0037]|uniref:type IX secretion system plug protein n=1 Tax=Pontibacter sp. SGAir0037 TaxID=2571030 RepID=UPI0010CD56EB|nr:DUF5103 domain-containing protein [Pontibacter sp. SGAir0037]QCR22435.1 DUF5103 domain-containing protein [Pontibacter sp. SGAir0037]
MISKTAYTLFLTALLSAGMVACVPIEQQGGATGATQTAIRYEDYTYDQSVQSVQCYVATGTADQYLEPPVVSLRQQQSMVLEFDRLHVGPQRLVAKIIHCNADWTPSVLTETQYLNQFNEFFINEVQSSVNTRVPYVHYQFEIPKVKLSGNYLLQVTEEGGNLLLTRRLLVYDELVTVVAKLGTPTGPAGRAARQPVEFNVFYKDYPLVNPSQEIIAVMRQNHRWDNVKTYPRPTFVRDDQARLEYTFFEAKDHFLGLSEFRPFDTRSIRFNGVGVVNINTEVSPVEVQLEPNRSRQGGVYSQEPDTDGKQVYGNREYGNAMVNADYTWVNFELREEEVPNGAVYLLGAFNDYRLSDTYRLRYDTERNAYRGRVLLKQGYYNYYYGFKPNASSEADAAYFEGSHFSTGNAYDVLIYYRPPGSRADLLIGYDEVYFNKR